MSEPLFIYADITITAAAFRRWLKSAPLAPGGFDDWPDSIVHDSSGAATLPALAGDSVADALVSCCVSSLGGGDGYIHCHYDEEASELRFGARYQYGDEAGVVASAILLCALLRGVAEVYTAKVPSRIYLIGTREMCIEIHKKSSAVLSGKQAGESPKWFSEWVSRDLDTPASLLDSLSPSLARAVGKQVSLGSLQATAQTPYCYGDDFWTDGKVVFRWPDGKVVEGADPLTFRKVISGMIGAAFYADSNQIWYCLWRDAIVQVTSIKLGMKVRGWRPFGADGDAVLCCGDTVWTIGQIDFPGKEKTQDNIDEALRSIELLGGIPLRTKEYDVDYLHSTPVDGGSFIHVMESFFEDKNGVYVATKKGLVALEGTTAGASTRVGELFLNNNRLYHGRPASEIKSQADVATLRHVKDYFYADSRHVYTFGYNGQESTKDLHVLKDANPACFRVMPFFMSSLMALDDAHVWIKNIPVELLLVPSADPSTVQLTESFFWMDAQHVYYRDKQLPDVDPRHFEVLPGSFYARYQGMVYYMTDPVPGADAASFVADAYHSAHDRYRRYAGGKEAAGDDAAD